MNLSDGLFTLRFLFQGGEAPPCSDAADADDSGRLDLKDVIYTFNFLLQGGPPPAQAFQCAVDPTSDDLDCRNYAPEDPSLACDGALDLADNGGGEAVGEVQPGLNARFQSGKGGLPPELAGLTDSGTSLGPEPPPSTAPERVSVLVHLAPGADRVPVRQFATDQGGVVQYEYTIMPNLMNLREIPRTALNALAHVPGVDRVEEDREAHAHLNDSAPLIRALQSQIRDAGLVADGSGVRVCICDTGIDSSHTMYASRIDTAAGRDFANGDNNPEDDFGHGSHVAGIAVGRTGLDISLPGCGCRCSSRTERRCRPWSVSGRRRTGSSASSMT